MHFLALRMDSHAQLEIRAYADVIGREIAARWVPLVWEAFEDYRLQAQSLSRIELQLLAALGRDDSAAAITAAQEAGWLETSAKTGDLKRHRERAEFEEKAEAMGIELPWNLG